MAQTKKINTQQMRFKQCTRLLWNNNDFVEKMNQLKSKNKEDSMSDWHPCLRHGSQLMVLFGCHNCWLRGTNNCPHRLKQGQKHANGICEDRLKHVYEVYALSTGPTNGRRFLRDMINANKVFAMEYLRERLIDNKGEGLPTEEESRLWYIYYRFQAEAAESMDRALKVDTGSVSINMQLKPSDVVDLIKKANEKLKKKTNSEDFIDNVPVEPIIEDIEKEKKKDIEEKYDNEPDNNEEGTEPPTI